MTISAIGLAALAAAQAASPQAGWVPLNSPEAKEMQGHAPANPKPVAQTPTPVPPTPAAPAVSDSALPSQAQASTAPPVTDGSQPLYLTCLGTGTANKATSAVAWGWGGWGIVSGSKDRGFNDQVDIRLFTGDDRIRLPRTMLPGIHGGDHGWMKLHDVVADARAIRASAGVNLMNNPKIYIDRVTGTISISGRAGDYSGQCQPVPADAPAKF